MKSALPIFLSFCAALSVTAAETGDANLSRARRNFCAYEVSAAGGAPMQNWSMEKTVRDDGVPNAKSYAHFYSEQLSDGSWPDINYTNDDRAAWLPSRHISRIYLLAVAWRAAASNDPDRAACLLSIHNAIGFWKKHDFQASNWWHNRIGIPKTLGAAAVLMGDELQDGERNYVANVVLKRAGFDMTGQNRVWLAGITFMRGLLLNSESIAEKAATVIWKELTISSVEGVQPDFSFHQHGPQQQFGNYGLSYAGDMVKWLAIFQGTTFAPTDEQVAVLRGYLDNGIAWTLWRERMDASCTGRQYDEDTLLKHGRAITTILNRFDALQGVTNRTSPEGNRLYWRSDMIIHRRPDFMASLKMCSSRTIGAESLNSENLSGYYTGDGVLMLSRSGEEYENIFPLWDWRLLPGITAPQSESPPLRFSNYKLTTSFSGGASDGTNGCAALDYSRDGTRAKKAWFFLNDQIICLGAGIGSTQSLPIATSVNQCWLRGEVQQDDRSVTHDGIRYQELAETKFKIQTGTVTGSWLRVRQMAATPKTPVTGDVFSVSIDHGTHPADANYAYAIFPGESKDLACHVVANTTNVQAIADSRGNLMAVFYAAGDLRSEGHTLTVDQPCILFVQAADNLVVYATDPTRTLGRIAFSWDGHYHGILPPRAASAGKTVRADF